MLFISDSRVRTEVDNRLRGVLMSVVSAGVVRTARRVTGAVL